jgi:hypothetical protein
VESYQSIYTKVVALHTSLDFVIKILIEFLLDYAKFGPQSSSEHIVSRVSVSDLTDSPTSGLLFSNFYVALGLNHLIKLVPL